MTPEQLDEYLQEFGESVSMRTKSGSKMVAVDSLRRSIRQAIEVAVERSTKTPKIEEVADILLNLGDVDWQILEVCIISHLIKNNENEEWNEYPKLAAKFSTIDTSITRLHYQQEIKHHGGIA